MDFIDAIGAASGERPRFRSRKWVTQNAIRKQSVFNLNFRRHAYRPKRLLLFEGPKGVLSVISNLSGGGGKSEGHWRPLGTDLGRAEVIGVSLQPSPSPESRVNPQLPIVAVAEVETSPPSGPFVASGLREFGPEPRLGPVNPRLTLTFFLNQGTRK